MHACIHTYIHMHTHAHTQMHACMRTNCVIHTIVSIEVTFKYEEDSSKTQSKRTRAVVPTGTQLDGPECRARRLLPKGASTKGFGCPASLHPMCILRMFAPACFQIACVHLISCLCS